MHTVNRAGPMPTLPGSSPQHPRSGLSLPRTAQQPLLPFELAPPFPGPGIGPARAPAPLPPALLPPLLPTTSSSASSADPAVLTPLAAYKAFCSSLSVPARPFICSQLERCSFPSPGLPTPRDALEWSLTAPVTPASASRTAGPSAACVAAVVSRRELTALLRTAQLNPALATLRLTRLALAPQDAALVAHALRVMPAVAALDLTGSPLLTGVTLAPALAALPHVRVYTDAGVLTAPRTAAGGPSQYHAPAPVLAGVLSSAAPAQSLTLSRGPPLASAGAAGGLVVAGGGYFSAREAALALAAPFAATRSEPAALPGILPDSASLAPSSAAPAVSSFAATSVTRAREAIVSA